MLTATRIPSAQEVKDKLSALAHAQVEELAERTATPFTTLWKIRGGDTENPRIETVRQFWPLLCEWVPGRRRAPKAKPEKVA